MKFYVLNARIYASCCFADTVMDVSSHTRLLMLIFTIVILTVFYTYRHTSPPANDSDIH